MDQNTKQVINNICPLYKEPNKNGHLETELLFGEYLEIDKICNNWALIKNIADGYIGWVETINLGVIMPRTHKIRSCHSLVFETPNVKSKVLFTIFLGSLIKIDDMDDKWAKIRLNDLNQFGYIHKDSIFPYSYEVNDWVSTAEKFISSPYKWGGKSIYGIDCSGLVQLSLQFNGINFPRNTNKQNQFQLNKIQDIDQLRRGDLVFWKGHVGIIQNSKTIIHANEFHMQVFSEDLEVSINRINNNNRLKPIFKRFNDFYL